MKKGILIAACLFASAVVVNAQKTDKHTNATCSASADTSKSENYVMMYKGKMMKIIDGTPSPLTESVKLNKGAKVNTDGTVNLPNGKMMKIKENQMVTMSGKMSMYKEK